MSSTEWDEISNNIGFAISDIATLVVLMDQTFNENDEYKKRIIDDLKERYERGREQHAEAGTTWGEWTPEDFVLNISEEIFDAIIYGAAFINKHAETVTIGDTSDQPDSE